MTGQIRGLDPALFRPEAIDPETAAFNAELEARQAQLPKIETLDPAVSRAAREAGKAELGYRPLVFSDLARDIKVPGPAGDVTLRLFVPPTVRGVYVYIHGGGFCFGRGHQYDPPLEQIARAAEVAVVSVDYRLAPEDPYPAGPDDCEAALRWVVAHARAELGSDRIVIGGLSAGANLAVVTMLRLRDRDGYTGFRGANLDCGVYDLTGTPSVRAWGDRLLVLSIPSMRWHQDNYVAPERQRDPDVSPLYADLAGLPPALFTVGTLDPLRDDTLFMHARWVAAGSPAELAVYAGGVHGFTGGPTALAASARAGIERFIRQAID